MSQFWYDEATSKALAQATIRLLNNQDGAIACLCCPSVFRFIKKLSSVKGNQRITSLVPFDTWPAFILTVHLFEFDKRFQVFEEDYIFYDYNKPVEIPRRFCNSYSVIIADPPFLSKECLEKISLTIQHLVVAKDSKIMLCTGIVKYCSLKVYYQIKWKRLFRCCNGRHGQQLFRFEKIPVCSKASK